MSKKSLLKIRGAIPFLLATLLLILVACGSSATATPPSATLAPGATAAPNATIAPTLGVEVSTPIPTAVPSAAGKTPWAKFTAVGKYGGTLRNAEQALPDHWDLHQSCCNPGPAAARDLYSNLLMFDPEDQSTLVGDLVESWEYSDDGLGVTFRLHKNAKWTDGEPVTADDVVFSLDRMVQQGVSRPRVKNIAPYYSSSKAVDANTVLVTTKFPSPAAFLPFLATDFMSILPKHVLDGREDAEEFFDDPANIVGSGAYEFVSQEIGQGWVLKKNEDYFKDGLPFLDGKETFIITDVNRIVTAFMTDQVDIFHRGASLSLIDFLSFQKDFEGKGLGIVTSSGFTLQGLLQLNWTAPPFNDPKVRRAVFLAMDRKEIIDVDKLGISKMGQPFFPGSPWASSDDVVATWPGFRYVDENGDLFIGDPVAVDGLVKHPDDIAEAKALMVEAGFADGFTASYHTYSSNKSIPVILKQQLKDTLGIDLEINITDVAATIAAEQGPDFSHIVSVHNGPNIVDPDDLFSGVFLSGAPRNPMDYEDPRMRELFDRQKGELDLAKRQAIVKEASDLVMEGEHHFIQYYWYGGPRWIVPNHVKNVVPRLTVQYGMGTEHIWMDR